MRVIKAKTTESIFDCQKRSLPTKGLQSEWITIRKWMSDLNQNIDVGCQIWRPTTNLTMPHNISKG